MFCYLEVFSIIWDIYCLHRQMCIYKGMYMHICRHEKQSGTLIHSPVTRDVLFYCMFSPAKAYKDICMGLRHWQKPCSITGQSVSSIPGPLEHFFLCVTDGVIWALSLLFALSCFSLPELITVSSSPHKVILLCAQHLWSCHILSC